MPQDSSIARQTLRACLLIGGSSLGFVLAVALALVLLSLRFGSGSGAAPDDTRTSVQPPSAPDSLPAPRPHPQARKPGTTI